LAGVVSHLHLLALSNEEARFSRRGFYSGDPLVRQRLEQIGGAFINGYNKALRIDEPQQLCSSLEAVEPELCGFAFEGAAMALGLLDNLTPWNNRRLRRFLNGPAARHIYMTHVGLGWAIARLPWVSRRINRCLEGFDPLLRWLAIDGFGFHHGYFYWQQYVRAHKRPADLSAYALRVFDQGLGRSLWFVECAEPLRISNTIASFSPDRHADLWSGVGLAAAYTGTANRNQLETLRDESRDFRWHLAQGAAFAAKARERAGNPTVHTDLGCRVFCEIPASDAAQVVDQAMRELNADDEHANAYEVWRERIRNLINHPAIEVEV
jgi:hypothetical protein